MHLCRTARQRASVRHDCEIYGLSAREIITSIKAVQPKLNYSSIWPERQRFALDVLFSLCTNIKSVALQLPEAPRFEMDRPLPPAHPAPNTLSAINIKLPPVAPFNGLALDVLQKSLETLIISEDTRWKGPPEMEVLEVVQNRYWRTMGTHTITLARFVRLRCLDIPMSALGRPHSIEFQNPTDASVKPDELGSTVGHDDSTPNQSELLYRRQKKLLPTTIEHLYSRDCNKHTFALLHKLNNTLVQGPALSTVELFFKVNPKHAIIQSYAPDGGNLNYPRVLSQLARKDVHVRFHTGRNETLFNMHSELAHMCVLSPLELCSLSATDVQFSDLNITAYLRRRHSTTGSRLFLAHHLNGFIKFFDRPTFDPRAWSTVAFLHGTHDKSWKNCHDFNDESKARVLPSDRWHTRIRGKRKLRRTCPFVGKACRSTILPYIGTQVCFDSLNIATNVSSNQRELFC
jgi:hypothetical protein